MKQIRFFSLLILLLGLAHCGNAVDEVLESAVDEVLESASAEQNESEDHITYANTTDTLSVTDIAPIPDDFPDDVRDNFDRYTQVIPPNGKPINLFAQSDLTDIQITHARDTLVFFLTDVPGSQYGADKSAVANQMGENEATLMILNGAHENDDFPLDEAQSLFEEELVVPGSDWYIDNNFEHRDATFEEIFHLVQDAGIGIDGHNSQPGVLPAYQQDIRAATNNATDDFQIWPIDAPYDSAVMDEFESIFDLNNHTQEYIAVVIDSYYGLWGPYDEADGGMWGSYIAKTRADVVAKDPMGLELIEQFLSPYLTYNAQLDPEFDGTFLMSYDDSEPYTHKSQYLLYATLTGSNDANLSGNDQDNELGGNSGDNVLDGMDGFDTAIYPRQENAYTITENDDGTITVVGDGTDTLVSIEAIQFADDTMIWDVDSDESDEWDDESDE